MRRILGVAVAAAVVAGSAGAQNQLENGVSVTASVSGTALGVPGGYASLVDANAFQYSDLFQLVGPVAPAHITFRFSGANFHSSTNPADVVHSGNANTTASVEAYDGLTGSPQNSGHQTIATDATLSQLGDGTFSGSGTGPGFTVATFNWTGGYFNFTAFAQSTASITSTMVGADATGSAQLAEGGLPNNPFGLTNISITDANGNSVFGPDGPGWTAPTNPPDRIYVQSGAVYEVAGGYGLDSDFFTSAVSISTLPEPSSLALLGTGLVGLASFVRRKRRV